MSDVRIMGCLLGKADGCDGEYPIFAYYNFVPEPGVPFSKCFQVNLETGEGKTISDAGDVELQTNLLPILHRLICT